MTFAHLPTFEFLALVVFAGLMATFGLLNIALTASAVKLPRLDFAMVTAKHAYGPTFEGQTPPYFQGQLIVYINGIFFALLYATVVGPYLPLTPFYDGIIWGVILYFASCLFYVPVFLGEGFFLSKVHKNAWATSALVHGIYGMIIGWLCPVLGA